MWDRIVAFFQNLWLAFKEALLFLGTPRDIIFAIIDLVILSLIFYSVFKLVRDSRAWQLLKGLVLIRLIGVLSNWIGLTALGYLLNRTISILAIAFVVLFQPELRRALETVGRARFKVVSAVSGEAGYLTRQEIEAIVQACGAMSEKRTGALIVIERSTPLGDLEVQENAVEVDANISETMLKQLFYIGSPLHDGAVLIRHHRIAAARIHIPLADSYHLRYDLGTRHRAAIGASEIGDTIAIVCSEERGTISITVGGRLYMLDNADALRAQLYRFLLPESESQKKRLVLDAEALPKSETEFSPARKFQVGMAIASFLLAFVFWVYVQATVNPVRRQNYQVPLLYTENQTLADKGLTAQYRVESINVTVKGRKDTLDRMTKRNVNAYVDLSEVAESGIQKLPVYIETDSRSYTQIDSLNPTEIPVLVRPLLPGEGN